MTLAVGGGIIPPVIGVIAGIIGTQIKHGKGGLPQSSNVGNKDELNNGELFCCKSHLSLSVPTLGYYTQYYPPVRQVA
jgi:hypothetical protein